MRNARRRWAAAGVAVAFVALAGCQTPSRDTGSATETASDTIRVGAFNFPESGLLAELYAQAMAGAGFAVAPVVELGSRETAQPALEQGRIDMLPEYAGSALNFVERQADVAGSSVERTHARLAAALEERGVSVAAPAPAQNQNAFAVRQQTAKDLNLRTLGDLRDVAGDLVAGGPPECPQRSTCLAGLRTVYGVEFERFLSVDSPAHVADALTHGEIDVGLLFTTDPAVPESGFVILEDDRELQPAENVVPVIRTATVEQYGDTLVEVLDAVSAQLTTRELVALNLRVQVQREPAASVARDWLAEHELTLEHGPPPPSG